MKIVYLDQNQWIALLRAWKQPADNACAYEVLRLLEDAVLNGRVILPLASANLYETYKINSKERREGLARLQARLSKGWVFVARHRRLEAELSCFAQRVCGLTEDRPPDRWFLSPVFIDAFPQLEGWRERNVSPHLMSAIISCPDFCMFDYLTSAGDGERKFAVRQWSLGTAELMSRLTRRRESLKNESLALRKRAYCATLMIDEFDVILETARTAGIPWTAAQDIGSSNARRMMREVPTYHVESELAIRLEDLSRPIEENDLRDMQTFAAVVPYADCIVAEKTFVNLARQSGLGKQYGTVLATDLSEVKNYL